MHESAAAATRARGQDNLLTVTPFLFFVSFRRDRPRRSRAITTSVVASLLSYAPLAHVLNSHASCILYVHARNAFFVNSADIFRVRSVAKIRRCK